MSKYVDLVIVKHRPEQVVNFLFYAPFASGLKAGDTVIVETKQGEQLGKVVAVAGFAKDCEEFKVVTAAAGASELKRVLCRAVPLDYSDERD